MYFKKTQGLIVTLVVAIIPIILWLLYNSSVSSYILVDIFARITAISAISLFAFNVILSVRLKLFERLFLGLDRTYRAHRLIGGTVLTLLLVHAMLVTFKYSSVSLISGYEFLKPGTNLALSIGSIALFIMTVSICVSVYLKIKYQWFVMIQRILGAMVIFGTYHSLFAKGSDVLSNIPLLIYLGLLEFIAISLYIYRSIFYKTIKQKYKYFVDSIQSDQAISQIWLKPKSRQLSFSAGQFAFFQFISDAVDEESHPFSFASGSSDNRIRIVVKDDGDYTNKLLNVKVGDNAIIEGPYGFFTFSKINSNNQVWLAGGIGIAPFLAMAHSLPNNLKVILYYCVASQSQAIFKNELEQIAIRNKNFKVITICSDTDKHIEGKTLFNKEANDYLLCASLPFMLSIKSQLIKQGINKNNIHYEEFGLR